MRFLNSMFWASVIFLIISFIAVVFLPVGEAMGYWQAGKHISPFSSLAILLAAAVALCTWIWNIRRQVSDDEFRESQAFFEKSFDTLNVLNGDGRAQNDRMRWLNSARLLRVAQQFGANIELQSHRSCYKEIEAYWRSRFRDLIEPVGEGFPETYFAERPEHLLGAHCDRDREPLDLSSVAVIYRFSQWPAGHALIRLRMSRDFRRKRYVT